MRLTRSCTCCGKSTVVHNYDEPAICLDCAEEDERDVRTVEARHNQVGAQWLAFDRGERGPS